MIGLDFGYIITCCPTARYFHIRFLAQVTFCVLLSSIPKFVLGTF